MGRPIKKIFIGERAGFEPGAALDSVTIGGTADTLIVNLDPLVIGAPDLAGGTQAEGYVESAAGDIDAVVITVAGSGYTAPPTVTVANQSNRTLTAVLGTPTSIDTILATAYILTTNEACDILAQKGNNTYKVSTATDGEGEATLINDTPTAVGEMAIVATDSTGDTYFVTKLYNNTVRLDDTNGSSPGASEFANGDKVEWAKDGVAVLNYSVVIT